MMTSMLSDMLSTALAHGPLLITAGAFGVGGFIGGYVQRGREYGQALDELIETLTASADELDA